MLVTNKSWIFLISIVCLFAALLAGCGNGGKSDNPGAGVSNSPSAATEPTAKIGPANIVVTYFPYADHLFALGKADAVKGVVNLQSLQDFSVYEPYLQGGKVTDIGTEVNLEQIMALNPDLIIASQNDEKYLEQLSKIAKTVTINASLNWQETIKGVAAAIGEEATAEEYIRQFVQKQSEMAAMMEKSGARGKTALFIMPWKKGFTYWSGSRMSLYYEKLGFKPFEGMQNVGEITLEGISKLNPEFIFIGKDYTHASEITLEDLAKDPVWNSLDAVKNNKMFVVDTEILGPLAMGQWKGLDYMNQLFTSGQLK